MHFFKLKCDKVIFLTYNECWEDVCFCISSLSVSGKTYAIYASSLSITHWMCKLYTLLHMLLIATM